MDDVSVYYFLFRSIKSLGDGADWKSADSYQKLYQTAAISVRLV
jgi:hypothetical protein